MILWLALAVMTGIAALALLWPLAHRGGGVTPQASDIAIYKDQLTEIERIQKRLGLQLPIVEVFSNDPHLADLASWRHDEGAA